jgi:hypothetical protein
VITYDIDRVTQWVAQEHGHAGRWPFLPTGAVGYEPAGDMTAGLIWYPRDNVSVWAHIAVRVPSLMFAIEAAKAVFCHAETVHFSVPAQNAGAMRLAAAIGAQQDREAGCTDPGTIHFRVQRESMQWLFTHRSKA